MYWKLYQLHCAQNIYIDVLEISQKIVYVAE